MTAVPRVRVSTDNIFGFYVWRCPACGHYSEGVAAEMQRAYGYAADHARICPALRLGRLVAELETLRDSRIGMRAEDLATWGVKPKDHCKGWAAAQRQCAADLDRLIKETNR